MHARLFTVALLLPLCVSLPSAFADEDDADDQPTALPPALIVPAGQRLAFTALGVGVQIYDCKAAGAGYQWIFRAPEATLYDEDGDVIGRHYAGPTWEGDHHGKVSGTVVGAVVAKVPSPDPTAIPWLRLVAVSNTGHGHFAHVTSIQRLYTVAGKAPATGCDRYAVGAVARVDYRANYYFYTVDKDAE